MTDRPPAATNEAAERLRGYLRPDSKMVVEYGLESAIDDLDDALATERRNIVKRIRERLRADFGDGDIWYNLDVLLDETEATPDDPISDARQPEDGPPPGRWPR